MVGKRQDKDPLATIGGVFVDVLATHEWFLTINFVGIIGTILFHLVPLCAAYRSALTLVQSSPRR